MTLNPMFEINEMVVEEIVLKGPIYMVGLLCPKEMSLLTFQVVTFSQSPKKT